MDGSNGEIVTVDLSRATVSRVTTSPASEDNPLWTPDGRQLVYEARTADQTSLFSMNADGTGEAQTLYSVPDALGLVPSGWVVGEQSLLFYQARPQTGSELGVLRLDDLEASVLFRADGTAYWDRASLT